MDNFLISVVIPIYNTEKYLEDCIKSVVNQSYTNLDIILVNDGSTDKSKDICEKWTKKDPRIRLINQINMGAAMAKNTGLDAIKGDLFMILDSDDLLHQNNIEILYNCMQKQNSEIIEACHTTIFEEFKNINIYQNNKIENFNTENALKELIISRKFHQTPWNKLYKTKLLKDLRFPKGRYIDDEYWTYKLFANSKKITWVDSMIYFYRQHEQSTMGRQYSIKRLDAIDALYERYNFIKEKFPSLGKIAYRAFLNNSIYNFQKLCMFSELDEDEKYRNDLLNKIKQSLEKDKINDFTIKDKLLFYSFCRYPYAISKIRNMLGRGI